MTNFILFLRAVFGGAWDLFQIQVPGFPFTFAHVVLAVSFGTTALVLVKMALGADGVVSRGKTKRNPKISEERKNDTK